MKQILEELYQHKTLSKVEANKILHQIATGVYNHSQLASFLSVFIMRPITLEELQGFREALLELCMPVDLSAYNPMDLCGTGGDGKNTFNISTLTSFIVAGAGIPVAKHGNYGVSSISGSSNVLEQMGIVFTADEQKLQMQLEKANICFLHAPLFHPAMRYVAPVRKEMKVKTFFNMLGPLVNPARPKIQMVGVFSLALQRMYQYLFQAEQDMQYNIVYDLDGFDELSLIGTCRTINPKGEQLLTAADFDMEPTKYEDLHGGDTLEEAAKIFLDILEGKGTEAQNKVVLANAALAIQTYHPERSLTMALAQAKSSLFEGKALNALQILKDLS